jgi:hypothetical protein
MSNTCSYVELLNITVPIKFSYHCIGECSVESYITHAQIYRDNLFIIGLYPVLMVAWLQFSQLPVINMYRI